MGRYGTDYLDRLLAKPDPMFFSELLGIMQGGATFDRKEPTYGFPVPIFLFSESQRWFSCSLRSGVWTYYEATPPARQKIMLESLLALAPQGYAQRYRDGMQNWHSESKIKLLDDWLWENEQMNSHWLHALLVEHRASVYQLCA